MARLCIILGVCIAGVTGEDNVTLPVATTLPHASLPRIQEEAQRSESNSPLYLSSIVCRRWLRPLVKQGQKGEHPDSHGFRGENTCG